MIENEQTIVNLVTDIENLKIIKQNLRSEIIQLDDEILFQDFGVYHPQYTFATSEQYKDALIEIREKQKEMIKTGTAATCGRKWVVNGSEKEGKKLIAENIKLTIRNFNIECDICIDKVKFSNYESSKARILKAYEMQNQLNETNEIVLSWKYVTLKIEELDFALSYQKKKKEEKEELRRIREQQREEAAVVREIEQRRKEFDKEKAHYENALKKINDQIDAELVEERRIFLLEKRDELTSVVADIKIALADLDYREANHRAGYVYIISNIGAFGENVFKIGMTRRLDPEDRIAELSGASVPFRFDVHAMIFSNDAPKLESALHNAFADKKLNLVNGRKEFFRVSLDEIKRVVRDNHDKTVDFIDLPDAEQFRESDMLRKHRAS